MSKPGKPTRTKLLAEAGGIALDLHKTFKQADREGGCGGYYHESDGNSGRAFLLEVALYTGEAANLRREYLAQHPERMVGDFLARVQEGEDPEQPRDLRQSIDAIAETAEKHAALDPAAAEHVQQAVALLRKAFPTP